MRRMTSMVIGLAIATILTAYISTLTMPNQVFAMAFNPCSGQILFSALGHPASNSGHVGSPIAQASFDPCSGQILFSALGHPASNSDHGVHSGLPGQIQTHPIENYLRSIGIQTTGYIRNLFIPAAQQHAYGIGLGIGVHKDTP
jgi:hypothetical protein